MISFPEIYARLTDADLFGNFGNRQATLDPSVAEMASENRFAKVCEAMTCSFHIERENIAAARLENKVGA